MNPLIDKTQIWAHRGASGYRPENTMESFALAAEMGADGVELDVHFTKDRKIVVIHDEKVDRTSNGQGSVTQYTYDELCHFDFGYHFYGELRGVKIPTLEEVYALLAPLGMTVNVEIKSTDPVMPKACIEIAQKYGMENKVIYSSFNHLQLARAKEADSRVPVAPLYGFNMLNPWDYALSFGAFAVHPDQKQLVLFENYVETCHHKGLRVHPWTANSEGEISFLLKNGCDAVITNYPDRALALRDKK